MGEYFTVIEEGIGEAYISLIIGFGTIIGSGVLALYRAPIFASMCIVFIPLLILTAMLFGGCVGKG